tara:strand:- start:26677 stop:26961 length:285 start_codon:yes stop_codon:yes gene_type:complete
MENKKMKHLKMITLATAVALSSGVAAMAMTETEMVNVLTGGLFNDLSAGGYETANIDKLTLSEVSALTGILGAGSMGDGEGQKIKFILDKAAKR